jgi:hypothetical protein
MANDRSAQLHRGGTVESVGERTPTIRGVWPAGDNVKSFNYIQADSASLGGVALARGFVCAWGRSGLVTHSVTVVLVMVRCFGSQDSGGSLVAGAAWPERRPSPHCVSSETTPRYV